MKIFIFSLIVTSSLFCFGGCLTKVDDNKKEKEQMQKKSIEEVMREHSDKIMSIEGVVGFYQGKLDDGRDCITIMVIELNEKLEELLPKELDGYPVIIEETGEIKPMNQ